MRQLIGPLVAAATAANANSLAIEYALTLVGCAFEKAARPRAPEARLTTPDALFDVLVELWPVLATLMLRHLHDETALLAVSRAVRMSAQALPPLQVKR